MAEGEPPNFSMKPFQVMLRLPKDPPPTLQNPSKFSKDFVGFLALCLQKDPLKRPEAKSLLEHSFIHKGTKNTTDILTHLANEAKTKFNAQSEN